MFVTTIRYTHFGISLHVRLVQFELGNKQKSIGNERQRQCISMQSCFYYLSLGVYWVRYKDGLVRVVGKPTIIMQIRVVGALSLSQLKGFPAVGQIHIACEFIKKIDI